MMALAFLIASALKILALSSTLGAAAQAELEPIPSATSKADTKALMGRIGIIPWRKRGRVNLYLLLYHYDRPKGRRTRGEQSGSTCLVIDDYGERGCVSVTS